MESLIAVLWAAGAILELALAVKLVQLRLMRTYPAFFAFLVGTGGMSLAGVLIFLQDTLLYAAAWVIIQPIYWTLTLCALIEVFQRMLAEYPGCRRIGRIAMSLALGLGAGICALVFLDSSTAALQSWRQFWFAREQALATGLAVFSVGLIVFVGYFRLQIPRNVLMVFAMLSLTLTTTAALWAIEMTCRGGMGPLRSLASNAVHIGLVAGLLWRFSSAGETKGDVASLVAGEGRRVESVLRQRLQAMSRLLGQVEPPASS